MPLVIPLIDPPPDPPSILTLQRRYKAKAERAMTDPAYRADLDINWWQDDQKAIQAARDAAAADSRLDPWNSSVDLPHIDCYDQRFRFKNVAVERAYWLDHLTNVEASTVRIERFEQCGRHAYLYRDTADQSFVLRSETCKLRICPACRRRYRFAAIARIRDLLQDLKPKTWQFMSFTIRHTRAPLRQQLDFLKASFRKLRQRQVWKRSCTHGYMVAEIKYNPHKDEWHPHLHMVVKCRYINWSELRTAWFQITKGSHQIDCGYVRSCPKACDYIAKYIAKPPFLTDIKTTERLQDYYDAIQNARILMPFGKPPRMPPRPTLDTPRTLEPIGHLGDLHHRAARGDEFAMRCLRALARQIDAVDRRSDPDLRKSIDPSIAYDPNDLLLPEPPP
ncbi:hypothetical protein ES703_49223 [subsurface metagenome]